MDVVGRLRRKSIASRCPRCGKYGPAYSTIRISTAEMESYHHFVGVCKETESTTLRNPFIAKVEDVEYLDCEDELTDIQADSLSKKYFQEKAFKKFWIVKGPSLAPKLTLHATTRIILPFSTTYLSETAFSALVAIKTKARNTLDVHNDFRQAVTHITPDIPSLAAGVQAQGSH
ncbi:hypothetical protein KUCAC02_023262 [Chaenocephalus aceratus]|uniref:Uncharacterized protein n=1 Tax=Chaenocephalus aceratus TaxID=36190 RepID=A0ACB9XQ63_CHAAC|nr:hypothetical protein KUCAC02_023262 [Chaenocephalus aceratus]